MDGLFIKDELPDYTAESAKDIILNNASSLDETRWRRTGFNKTSGAGCCAPFQPIWRAKAIHIAGSGTSEADSLSLGETKRKSSADCRSDGELVGVARVLICTFTMEPQTFHFLVTSRECVDHGYRRIRGIIG